MRKIVNLVDGKGSEPINTSNADQTLQNFIFSYQCMVHEMGIFEETREKILKFQNDCAEFVRIFGLEWNRKRLDVTTGGDVSPCQEKKQLVSDNGSPCCENKRLAHFIKVTPKSDLLQQFRCMMPKCSKIYQNLKSLRRHLKDDHKGQDVPDTEGMTEAPDVVTCKMCWKKIRRDKITTHLISVHKCVKEEGVSSVLRGFVSFDDKNWRPLWLPRFVDNPPEISEAKIPVVDGKFHYYGGIFNADMFECEVVEEELSSVNDDGLKDVLLQQGTDTGLVMSVEDSTRSVGAVEISGARSEGQYIGVEAKNSQEISIDREVYAKAGPSGGITSFASLPKFAPLETTDDVCCRHETGSLTDEECDDMEDVQSERKENIGLLTEDENDDLEEDVQPERKENTGSLTDDESGDSEEDDQLERKEYTGSLADNESDDSEEDMPEQKEYRRIRYVNIL